MEQIKHGEMTLKLLLGNLMDRRIVVQHAHVFLITFFLCRQLLGQSDFLSPPRVLSRALAENLEDIVRALYTDILSQNSW